jgi:hypothetical protein
MDIQAEKIELAKLILSTDDKGLISQIRSLFKNKEENWWEEFPPSVKLGINESIIQADRGEFISYNDVKKEVSALLKKWNCKLSSLQKQRKHF